MYPKWMKYTLCYFDLWGFYTEFNSTPFYQKLKKLFVIHMILGVAAEILFLMYTEEREKNILGTLNDAVKLQGFQIFYWVTIFESFTKRKKQQEFWTILQEIDRKHRSHRALRLNRYIFYSIFGAFMISLSHAAVIYECFTFRAKYAHFWILYIIIIVMFQNRIFYCLFYIEIIESELRTIYRDLEEMKSIISAGELLRMKFERNRLKWIREYNSLIYDLCHKVNSVMGWSNTVTTIFSFVLLLTDINWIYWKWYNEFTLIRLSGLLLIVLMKFIKFSPIHCPISVDHICWTFNLILIIFYQFKTSVNCIRLVRALIRILFLNGISNNIHSRRDKIKDF